MSGDPPDPSALQNQLLRQYARLLAAANAIDPADAKSITAAHTAGKLILTQLDMLQKAARQRLGEADTPAARAAQALADARIQLGEEAHDDEEIEVDEQPGSA